MRQFIASLELDAQGNLRLSEKERRYLKNVLRLKLYESISVRLLDGNVFEMCLAKRKDEWFLEPANGGKAKEKGVSVKNLEKKELEIILLQAATKPNKMDLIIRQATECGVKTIVPIKGNLSQNYDFETKQERWQKIIKEALQQSGSALETKIVAAIGFDEYFVSDEYMSFVETQENSTQNDENKKKNIVKYYLAEDKRTDSLFSFLFVNGKPQKVFLAVGCEGGLSKKEVAILETNGFLPLHLSTNILRAETAALYGLAILQNAIMEFDSWQRLE